MRINPLQIYGSKPNATGVCETCLGRGEITRHKGVPIIDIDITGKEHRWTAEGHETVPCPDCADEG